MVTKIAVTTGSVADLDRWVREGRYPNRSRALQSAVDMLSEREKRSRLARELAKINPSEENENGGRGAGGCFVAAILRGDIFWADLDPVGAGDREPNGIGPSAGVGSIESGQRLARSETLCSFLLTRFGITSQAERQGLDFRLLWPLPAVVLIIQIFASLLGANPHRMYFYGGADNFSGPAGETNRIDESRRLESSCQRAG